jgi:diguanylate cyclase (GGDEF)-like protein/PAS domain S-box-containing protein
MPEKRTVSFDLIPDAIVTVDRCGIVRQVNSQLTAMFGYHAEELIGEPIEILLPKRARQRHVHHRTAFQISPAIRPMGRGLELYGCRKDGSEFPLDIMLSSLSTADGLVLAVIRDTSESKNLNERLTRLAYSDPLTNLPNRAALYRDLKKCLNGNQTTVAPISIVLFDLDGFKEVNDTMGHSCGDQLLRGIAQRWTAVIGEGCRIYRLGGDEFIAVVSNCGDPRRISQVAKTILAELEKPFDIAGTVVFISASAGIALAPADGANIEELIANVDMALYKAKANGRGSSVFFHNALRADVHARREMDIKLRKAHSRGELELYFQPQVRLADATVVGSEALLRWDQGPTPVAPGAFIHTLAASPIAPAVGSWILRTACETAAEWRNKGLRPIRVAVNLFPTQFHNPTFVTELEGVLADTGLPPDLLELEITENIALSCNVATLAPLRKLRELGVRIAFDDFGTGYASLSLLAQMPLTHIKIDQSFVRGVPDDPKLVAIVRSLIAMAHNVGLSVIAEGVETVAQARFLQLEGCDEAQGFLFAKPLTAPAFEALLRAAPLIRRMQPACLPERSASLALPRRTHFWTRHSIDCTIRRPNRSPTTAQPGRAFASRRPISVTQNTTTPTTTLTIAVNGDNRRSFTWATPIPTRTPRSPARRPTLTSTSAPSPTAGSYPTSS